MDPQLAEPSARPRASVQPNDPCFCPGKAEWIGVWASLAAGLLINLLTFNLFPVVWTDDILWSEPAINLVRTGHFTTSVFQLQPAGSFWAAHSPLYPLVLSLWLKVAGFSLLGIKSFNLLLVSVAAFLVWVASWRYRLIDQPWARLLIVPLLLLGYSMSFAYRSSRPDIAGLISLLALWLAFSAQGRWKNVWIFISAAATVWVGIQIGLYASWATFLALVMLRAITVRQLLIVAAGILFGGCSMLFFYYSNGVLEYFLATVSQAANEHAHWGQTSGYLSSIPRRLKAVLVSYVMDYSILPLLAGLLFLRWRTAGGFSHLTRRIIRYQMVLFLTIPVLFSFTGHFAFYYSFMIYVPLVLAFASGWSDVAAHPRGRTRSLWLPMTGAAVAAALIGLPLRLCLAAAFCQISPRSEYLSVIRTHVRPEDVVFSADPAFFETKQVAQKVYARMYSRYFLSLSARAHDFTEAEKNEITVLIIQPGQKETLEKYFGGRWISVSQPFGDSASLGKAAQIPLLGKRLVNHFSIPQMARYQLQIFRRVPEAGAE